jgi:hypothetical protein
LLGLDDRQSRARDSCAISSPSWSSGNHTWADRTLLTALLSVIPKARRQGLRLLITPDTILRWHSDIVPAAGAGALVHGFPRSRSEPAPAAGQLRCLTEHPQRVPCLGRRADHAD